MISIQYNMSDQNNVKQWITRVEATVVAPFSRCNPITEDGNILIGAKPYTIEDINGLINYGINIVVNLVDDNKSNYPSKDYPSKDYPSKDYPSNITIINFHIKNGGCPSLNKCTQLIDTLYREYLLNKKIFIHCQGGHGRAGLIGALLIGKINGYNGNESIEELEKWRELRVDKSRNFIPTPETQSQVNFICKILGHDKNIPNRSDRSWLIRVKKERKQSNKNL